MRLEELELKRWWLGKAEAELEAILPKVVEYSAVDLEIMGAALCPEDRKLGIEQAIAFYALGKVARIVGAHAEGRAASDDSWHDLGVYARMAQRVRESGGWPGTRTE